MTSLGRKRTFASVCFRPKADIRGHLTNLIGTTELITVNFYELVTKYRAGHFVVGILVGLVQFQALAAIRPAPGVLAFGAVVVLTMFAALSFEPRLIWDNMDKQHA